MAGEHCFDTFNKLLTHDAPRRSILGALALTFGHRFGASDAAAKNGGKGEKNKRKKKGKGNDKKDRKRKDKKNGNGAGDGAEPAPNTPSPPPSCSSGSCAQEWAGDQAEINYCEFICRQCDGDDSRDFCILEDGDGDKVADCCTELSPKCCGKQCCDTGASCCAGRCCGGPDNPEVQCCGGRCFDTAISSDHCGTCGNACNPGEFCSDGSCWQVCQDQNCPPGQLCYNGNNQYCSGQATFDCQCGCGGSNYCPHPVHGAVCQSSPC